MIVTKPYISTKYLFISLVGTHASMFQRLRATVFGCTCDRWLIKVTKVTSEPLRPFELPLSRPCHRFSLKLPFMHSSVLCPAFSGGSEGMRSVISPPSPTVMTQKQQGQIKSPAPSIISTPLFRISPHLIIGPDCIRLVDYLDQLEAP